MHVRQEKVSKFNFNQLFFSDSSNKEGQDPFPCSNRLGLFSIPEGSHTWPVQKTDSTSEHGVYCARELAAVNFAKDDVKKYQKWHLNVPTLNRTVGHQIAREISQK